MATPYGSNLSKYSFGSSAAQHDPSTHSGEATPSQSYPFGAQPATDGKKRRSVQFSLPGASAGQFPAVGPFARAVDRRSSAPPFTSTGSGIRPPATKTGTTEVDWSVFNATVHKTPPFSSTAPVSSASALPRQSSEQMFHPGAPEFPRSYSDSAAADGRFLHLTADRLNQMSESSSRPFTFATPGNPSPPPFTITQHGPAHYMSVASEGPEWGAPPPVPQAPRSSFEALKRPPTRSSETHEVKTYRLDINLVPRRDL